jgi:hypothetical protein
VYGLARRTTKLQREPGSACAQHLEQLLCPSKWPRNRPEPLGAKPCCVASSDLTRHDGPQGTGAACVHVQREIPAPAHHQTLIPEQLRPSSLSARLRLQPLFTVSAIRSTMHPLALLRIQRQHPPLQSHRRARFVAARQIDVLIATFKQRLTARGKCAARSRLVAVGNTAQSHPRHASGARSRTVLCTAARSAVCETRRLPGRRAAPSGPGCLKFSCYESARAVLSSQPCNVRVPDSAFDSCSSRP